MAIQQNHEFLPSHPLLRTRDLDEARHLIGRKFCDHKLMISSRRESLNVRHNHVSGTHVSINYLDYGADVQIDPGTLNDFYLLQIPLSGRAVVRHRGADIVANSATATLLNPDRETEMRWDSECRKLLLQISKTHLETVAKDLLGSPVPGPIRFDPIVDLTGNAGRMIRNLVIKAAHLAETDNLFSGQCTAQDRWAEENLASVLLMHQNSNISHMVKTADRTALPSGLRRAIDYIHANLAEPIRVADIARHAGMNARTLQKGFLRTYGKSPMNVLRAARLDAAHYQLSQRHNRPSVTDVAFSTGFSHLGRFSQDYKERFGVLPSQCR